MGNVFSFSGKANSDMSNLRLAAQKITAFSGDYQEFAQWKKSTECALQGTGYDRILTDEKYSKDNPNMSSTVFAQLSLAVIQGSANHVVEDVEKTKNGYEAWQALIAWYEESDLDHETSDALRTKITRLYLDSGGSASDYINCFQTYNRNLDGISDGEEKFSERTKVQMFLKHIRDPHYKTTIEVIKNLTGQGSLKLIQVIARIRKCELELIQERKTKRRYSTPRRKKRKIDADSDDDPARITPDHTPDHTRPHKLRRMPSTVKLTPSGRISISKPEWMEASDVDRTFIQDWNSRVKNGEKTDDLTVPSGTKLLPTDGASQIEQRIRRQVDQAGSKMKTPEMKEKDNKRISFNLHNQFHGAEEPIDDDSE
jgi:hypothetical protein